MSERDWRYARQVGEAEKIRQLKINRQRGLNNLSEDQIRKKARDDSTRQTHEAMRRAEDK